MPLGTRQAKRYPFFIDREFYAPLCRTVKKFITPQCAVMRTLIEKQLQTFGGNVRRFRNTQGITQEKLAEESDLNIRTVQKIEAGQTNILITTAVRIQRALGCDWNELMNLLEKRTVLKRVDATETKSDAK